MFGRKAKLPPERAESRRQVQRGSMSPAFSYYTNRTADPSPNRSTVPPKQPQHERERDNSSATRSLVAGVQFWVLLIVVIVCAFKVLILSADPKVVVVGETPTSSTYLRSPGVYESAARKLLTGSVTNRSKLTIDTQGVAGALKNEFPELRDVSISIPLVNSRPVIYIQPASPSLILQASQGNFALSQSGIVLSALQKLPTGVPSVVDQSGLTPIPGKQVLASSTVSFVQTVLYQFTAAHLNITAFVLPVNSPYELDVRLTGKPYIIRFNLEEDALTQSGAAIATVGKLGSATPSTYIDVRVPGRVYYK